MQQGGGDYGYYQYSPNPSANLNPNPTTVPDHSYASAPPFSANYTPSDYATPAYPAAAFPSYSQNPDPVPTIPPTAPSYTSNPNLNLQPFNPAPAQPSSPFPSYDQRGLYQPPTQQQPYYPSYDQHQTAPNYAPPSSVPPNANPNPAPPYTAAYSSSYSNLGSSVPPVYENSYQRNVKFDQGGRYSDEASAGYRPDFGPDLYGKRSDGGMLRDDGYGFGDGAYAYKGSKVEPYGARGTAPKSSTWSGFDDFGRPISFPSGKDQPSPTKAKIVKAVPKADTQEDVKSGVQKFRVKILPESGGQSTMDVLCQIGLDGVRMLDPSTSRTLRIYPLDTVTRFQVFDSSIFAFWAKSSVDIEPRRIRLQSNSYTTNTILDIVTAATVQFKEMGGRSKPSDSWKPPELPAEKKKGFADLMYLIRPGNEEKDHWIPDEAVSKCTACGTDFSAFVRKHHCRNCGDIFCDKCTHGRIALTADENAQPVRVCDRCMAEVTQRLSIAKEAASKSAAMQSHEDLAKKLQDEMERNRKSTSGSRSDGSGRRMKEVACPTCTVHLQVQVPSSGSETIECGVCQHPFLVSAH
ncbi:protein FREE1 [Diospyros lotus]|uniref:protein FREE1 n=1 Tax=Diospyros lotus TaxID=55363 RepID=UPI0022571EE1|nr:protein FREE1 [Diospyros lotus]XP_052201887.1 protein FREE1 [Diospyros lotus]